MPTYVMVATDGTGDEREIVCSIADRPELFATRVIDGREFQRLPSHEHKEKLVVEDFDFAAVSLPINDPDYPRVNEHGEGHFRSAREIREFLAKKRAQGVEINFDRHGFR